MNIVKLNDSYVRLNSNWTRACEYDFNDITLCEINSNIEGQTCKEIVDDSISLIKPIILVNPYIPSNGNITQDILSQSDDSKCEISLKVSAGFRLREINLTCNVEKVEIFEGALKAYLETVNGSLIKNIAKDNHQVKDKQEEEKNILLEKHDVTHKNCYSYSIRTQGNASTILDLRFITRLSSVSIFGIKLQLIKSIDINDINPCPYYDISPMSIDLNNVRNILQKNFSLSTSIKAEQTIGRYHQLVETIQKFNMGNNIKRDIPISVSNGILNSKTNNPIFDDFKHYIDERFAAFELNIQKRLDAMESRQVTKLNEILNKLS